MNEIEVINKPIKRRYWLRFGFIFGIIGLIIAIGFKVAAGVGINLDGLFNVYMLTAIAMGPGLLLAFFVSRMFGCQIFTDDSGLIPPAICSDAVAQGFIILSSVFIAYFVIGMAAGFMYEVHKNKLPSA